MSKLFGNLSTRTLSWYQYIFLFLYLYWRSLSFSIIFIFIFLIHNFVFTAPFFLETSFSKFHKNLKYDTVAFAYSASCFTLLYDLYLYVTWSFVCFPLCSSYCRLLDLHLGFLMESLIRLLYVLFVSYLWVVYYMLGQRSSILTYVAFLSNFWSENLAMQELGKLASSFAICLHVDFCLGGFVLPFARKLG